MQQKPKIDEAIGERIDEKIDAAKIIPSVDSQSPLPATTTAQEDLKTKGQRHINLIWEGTQASIAILVTIATLIVVSITVIRGGDSNLVITAFVLISNIFFMIATFYFQRTNHTKTGGVGGTDDKR